MAPIELLSGLHAPNRAFGQDDYRVVRAVGGASVKLLCIEGCEHTPADLLMLRSIGVRDFTVRLRDTRRHSDGVYPSAEEYVASVLPKIRAFYALGVRRFQLDNEPNVYGMWDHHGYGPWEYQFFMRAVLRLLAPNLPPDVILVSPPLSFAPGLWNHDPPGTPWEQRQNKTDFVLNDWWAAFHFTDGRRLPNLWRTFLWRERPGSGGQREGGEVGGNVYCQSERQMADTSYGAAHEQLHARAAGMDVCVLEYGCSAHLLRDDEGRPRYTMPEVHEMRRAQYPEWVGNCRELGYVTRTYAYILPGASDDWAGYRLTEAEALLLGAEQERGEGGRALGGGRGII